MQISDLRFRVAGWIGRSAGDAEKYAALPPDLNIEQGTTRATCRAATLNHPMNAVIACGGTGGHLFPGLAVAEVLHARGHEVLLFVSEKEVDTLAV